MRKSWQPYALHVLDAIAKMRCIQARGDLAQDEVLYDAVLRNLQRSPKRLNCCPMIKNLPFLIFPGVKSADFATFSYIIIWATLTR